MGDVLWLYLDKVYKIENLIVCLRLILFVWIFFFINVRR